MAFVESANFETKEAKGSGFLDIMGGLASFAAPIVTGALTGGASSLLGNVLSGATNEAVKAGGGNIPQMMLYNGGGTHEQNPMGGIPVDQFGNPSLNASALVEQGEVGYKLPNDKSGYVFSNRIKYPGSKHTFADEAKKITSKYKNRLGKDLNKPDALAKKSLDMEMEALKNGQEEIKQMEQAQSMMQAMGGYLNALAQGGYLNQYPEGGEIDPSQNTRNEYISKLKYSPENKVVNRAKRYPSNEVINGNVRVSPVYTQGYNERIPVGDRNAGSVDYALSTVLNNQGILDKALETAVGDSLNSFLDPRAIQAIDSLNNVNFRSGDTTGRHAAIEHIAKRFPESYVTPSKVLSPELFEQFQNALGSSTGNTAHAGLYATAPTKTTMISTKNTAGTKDKGQRGDIGNEWGIRNAAATSLNVHQNVGVNNPVTPAGKQIEGREVFTVPVDYDLKTQQYNARVTNARKPYSGAQDASTTSMFSPITQENYRPEQFERRFGSKASGGYLKKLKDGGDAANYLKGAGYNEAMLGYGIQGLTRLPQLFTSPESISYDRVNPELVDFAQERGSMETSRNAQLGFLKRQAGMAGNAGQALNYLASAVPSAYNQYDQQYAQSIEREQNTNAQIMNQANAQNAQIQMKEAEANAMERDAARSIRDQALGDIGNIGLGAMMTKPNMMNQYNTLKAQGLIGDYDISWNADGSPNITRKPEATGGAATTKLNTSVGAQANINAKNSFGNPMLNSLGINPNFGSTPAGANNPLMGKKLVPGLNGSGAPLPVMPDIDVSPLEIPDLGNYQFTIPPVTTPPVEMYYTPRQQQIRDQLLNTGRNPDLFEDYACGGSLKKCKGGYIKKKGKK